VGDETTTAAASRGEVVTTRGEIARREAELQPAGPGESIAQTILALPPAQAQAVIEHAAAVAKVFHNTIRDAGLIETLDTKDGPKPHIKEAGWSLLSGLLGAHVEVTEPEPVDFRGQGRSAAIGWRVLAIVRDTSGRELAADWGMCLRSERRWAGSDDYAVMGMAGTRAARRAQSRAFGWIVRLAGLEPTPAEEAGGEENGGNGQKAPPRRQEGAGAPPSAPKGQDTPKASEPAAPPEAGQEGQVKASQIRKMAERRGVPEAALADVYRAEGFRWPLAPAHELETDEELYMKALEAVSRWEPAAAAS
jgi:hypothetical protein